MASIRRRGGNYTVTRHEDGTQRGATYATLKEVNLA
jgi:hypothetical protein